jgi:chemotaxis protein CheD
MSAESRIQAIVGVGDMAFSADPAQTLVTYALGSCLGVTAWDRERQLGGLLHFMLPLSSVNPEKAEEKPAMFGDKALPAFLEKLFQMGASRRHLQVKIAGGAEIHGPDSFEIGKRNLLLARRLLWKNGLAPEAEAVGGSIGRTLRLEIGSGRVLLKDPAGEREL